MRCGLWALLGCVVMAAERAENRGGGVSSFRRKRNDNHGCQWKVRQEFPRSCCEEEENKKKPSSQENSPPTTKQVASRLIFFPCHITSYQNHRSRSASVGLRRDRRNRLAPNQHRHASHSLTRLLLRSKEKLWDDVGSSASRIRLARLAKELMSVGTDRSVACDL